MENPFDKRATEYLREDEAFLAVVTPEPVEHFLAADGRPGRLYDRLVLLRGTPGSGKTTLARLFEYPTFTILSRNPNFEGHKHLAKALASCNALRDGVPQVLAYRLPLETDYRGFWEFGYGNDLKASLMTAMLQARCVLGWFRHLKASGVDEEEVEIVIRPEAVELVDTIGGTEGRTVREKAAAVERSIYQVMTALVAPAENALPSEAVQAYRPFDIIDKFRIHWPNAVAPPVTLSLLAIFDDAHILHPDQFDALQKFLLRRELRVGRWLIARFDILHPHEMLRAVVRDATDTKPYPGVSATRDAEIIHLQSVGDRSGERGRFRRMAKGMAARYLSRMPIMGRQGLTDLSNLLETRDVAIPEARLRKLRAETDSRQRQLSISERDREVLEDRLAPWKEKVTPDVHLQMLQVMMSRFAGRKRRGGPKLFELGDETPIEVAANNDVRSSAEFQLLHKHDRPYFYGVNDLCDASNENAEQFLQLAAVLVGEIATRLTRNRKIALAPAEQHRLLVERGRRVIAAWNFPNHVQVRRLIREVSDLCLKKSLHPSGAVTANAIGVLQEDFDDHLEDFPGLARALQFALAYGAVSIIPNYSCKGRTWCLIELGGMVLLANGLTLKRGGFVESDVAALATLIDGGEA